MTRSAQRSPSIIAGALVLPALMLGTADMPVDEQYRFSFGVKQHRDDGSTLMAVLTYVDLGDAEIDSGDFIPAAGYTGDYSENRLIAFSIAYGFGAGGGRR